MTLQDGNFAWQPEMDRIRQRWGHRALASSFLQAMDCGAISLVFQPVREAGGGAGDALLHHVQSRWQCTGVHDLGGWRSCHDAIQALRKLGHIAWFDMVMLHAVLDLLRDHPHIRLACDLNARSLSCETGWPDVFARLSHDASLAQRLTLLVADGAFIQDRDAALTVLRSLRRNGCQIGIDGVGAGGDALTFAHACQPQWMRIDAQVVALAVQHGGIDAPWFEALIRLCRSLADTVAADGVHSDAACTIVVGAGVSLVQGDGVGQAQMLPNWLDRPVLLQARHPLSGQLNAPVMEKGRTAN